MLCASQWKSFGADAAPAAAERAFWRRRASLTFLAGFADLPAWYFWKNALMGSGECTSRIPPRNPRQRRNQGGESLARYAFGSFWKAAQHFLQQNAIVRPS